MSYSQPPAGQPQQPYGAAPQPYGAAPQPYGAAPQPYGYAPAAAPTNTMAIIALIGGLLMPIVGIICGHISLGQIKRTGESGKGMAMAGLILGYAFTAIGLLVFFAYILFFVIFGVALWGAGTTSSTYYAIIGLLG